MPDIESECDRIVARLRDNVYRINCTVQGGVVGISGGIDSSVSLALAVQAFGAENVLGIMLPEKDSSGDSARFAQKLADKFGVRTITENITGALQGFGCYARRDEAVKRVFPEYDPATYKMKIGVKTSGLYTNLPPLFSLPLLTARAMNSQNVCLLLNSSRLKQLRILNNVAGCRCCIIMPNACIMQ